jgi:cytochrome c-type biogenesis protein CcmH/NrfG
MILLVTSFAAAAVLTATLTLGGESAINKRDPIFDALSRQPSPRSGWSGEANFAMGGATAPTPQAISDTSNNVASLADLVPGLEAKVAANPDDADLQVLLAQTYVELDRREKATQLLDKLDRRFPGDDRVPFIRASTLMENDDAADLRKAIHLFEEGTRRRPAVLHMARLHQGQILIKLGDRKRAITLWQDFITTLRAGDARRTLIEAELAKATSGEGVPGSSP